MTVHQLLADDDRAIRESLERAFELEGYEVTAVPDGVQALSVARRLDPDLIVLDVMMPGVDGIGVCRVLRADGGQNADPDAHRPGRGDRAGCRA